MRRNSRILAADCGAGHVACAVFTATKEGRLVLQQFALEAHSADPALDSTWPDRTGQALAAVVEREHLREACTLAVPGHLALVKFAKAPAVEKSKRNQIIQFEAAQSIPYPLGEVTWDFIEVTDDGVDLDLMFAAVKTDAMAALCAATVDAALPPHSAMPGCVALLQAYQYNYGDVAGGALVIDIGARSTHLLFAGAGLFFVRTLALAGNAVTQAIAEDLKIDFIEAEALKRQVIGGHSDLPETSPSRLAVCSAVGNFIQRLHLELARSLLGHARLTGASQPSRILLTGGGGLIPGLAATLADKLKLPVEPYDALRNVELTTRAKADGAVSASHYLPVLTGLATGLVRPGLRAPNLLPRSMAAEVNFRRRQPWWLAAAALLTVALLPPIWHFHQAAVTAKTETARIERQLAPLRALERRNLDNLARMEEVRRQIGAIRGLVATKSNWLGFLGDLQGCLVKVEDVWLERLRVIDAPAPAGTVEDKSPPLRLAVSGRLLDTRNPVSKVSPDSYARVMSLLAGFSETRFVTAIEDERFDNSQPGILRFDFTVVVSPENPL